MLLLGVPSLSGGWEKCTTEKPKATPHTRMHTQLSQKPAQPDEVTLAGKRAAPDKECTGSQTLSILTLPDHCTPSDIIGNSQFWKPPRARKPGGEELGQERP